MNEIIGSYQRQSPWLQNVIIRLAEKRDLGSLEWEGEYIHFRKVFADAYRMTTRGEAVLWIAELPEVGLIGQLIVQLTSRRSELANGKTRAYIYGFRIRPRFRSQGLGTKVMKVVEADLIQKGFRQICLNVGQDNEPARRLYERLGYRVMESDPGRWSFEDHLGRTQHVIEPAWRMEKYLYRG